jgi:hypothetical protein
MAEQVKIVPLNQADSPLIYAQSENHRDADHEGASHDQHGVSPTYDHLGQEGDTNLALIR